MASLSLSVPIASNSRAVASASSAASMPLANETGPLMIARRRVMSSRRNQVVCMAPEEEKMTRRFPLYFPIEWERPKPGRRPDVFPQFSPMKTTLPPPLPADPPEEEEKKEEEEDPDKPEKQSRM